MRDHVIWAEAVELGERIGGTTEVRVRSDGKRERVEFAHLPVDGPEHVGFDAVRRSNA